MDLYILDSLLRPIDVDDTFISLLWTERFKEYGDFEFVTFSSQSNKKRYSEETKLVIDGSKRVMKVETVEDTTDDDGRKILKIKGREITHILEGRVALDIDGITIKPSWIVTGMTPGNVMRHMFTRICVDGSINVNDQIPLLVPGATLYPTDTIDEPAGLIDWEQKPTSLYAALRELSDIYDLGFRLYRDPNVTRLLFNVYAGSDRTTQQTELPPVVFSPDLENIQNTTEISTIVMTYNVAVVIWIEIIPETEEDPEQTVVHYETVYSDEDSPAMEGFDRRVLMVEVTSIPEEIEDVSEYLRRCGKDELMKFRPIRAFGGEVTKYTQYVYERDYYLGDLVEMRDQDGTTSNMRVVEQIFVDDEQGERRYPTLLTQEFVEQGVWTGWKYNVPWVDMGLGEFWVTQE